MLVTVKRQKSRGESPYYETFSVEANPDWSVAALLGTINQNDALTDLDGRPTEPIGWECSCLESLCGACAMRINGKPALACAAFLRDLGDAVTLEPLGKFPVTKDLTVDRSVMFENLRGGGAYPGSLRDDPSADEHLYSTAKCLKCGLCLEVCPNYRAGESFFGADFVGEAYLAASRTAERKEELLSAYREHFKNGCTLDRSCLDVCPMKIDTLASIVRLNKKQI